MRTIRLVPDELSTDLGECLNELLEMYQSGRLRGLAFVGRLKGLDYIGNTAGVSHYDPTRARGELLGLDDKLSQRVHRGNNGGTPA